MAFDANDEILQDFLIEASEILEQLNEQLVDLEHAPDDKDLLNRIFRGFHTIKGGAGFLELTPLVEVCHRAEDIFNLLRNGDLVVDAALMDVMLPVLDELNRMFDLLRSGQEPDPAPAELLTGLEAILQSAADGPSVSEAVVVESEEQSAEPPDAADQEFESFLEAIDSEQSPVESAGPATGNGDEISDEEFEALLDELQGKGKGPAVEVASGGAQPDASSSSGDDISDDDFEALLDQLHGKGKAPGKDEPAAPPPPAAAGAGGGQGGVPVPAKPAAADEPKPKPPARAEQPAKAAPKEVAPAAETTVRVDTARLDSIMNLVGELVLTRNRLNSLQHEQGDEEVAKTVANLDMITVDLQAAVMKTRMQPIKKVFGRFPRVVRDLARSLKKEVNLELVGEETDLDKNLVDALADPLVHLVRNSVDHGIEMPDERVQAGKSRSGTVTLSAEQAGDHILIYIQDDGAGMDPEVLRRKAVEKGMMDEEAASRLTDGECYNLILHPGFSTKSEISDISGRGVGMDVVKNRINELNGSIDIDSEKGKGSKISIKVPLTLAIMPTLMVKLQNQPFALPLANVDEIFNLDLTHTNIVDGQRVVMLRNKPVPLFYLTRWLAKNCDHLELPSTGHVVVVHVGSQLTGFVVDQLVGQEEVVIKPLGALLQKVRGLAGATITGDGRIALILDVQDLLKAYARRIH